MAGFHMGSTRHEGSLSMLCIFFHFLHTLRVTLSTFGKCLPIQFSDMIRIWIFAFVKCPPLRFYFFPYFSDLFACRAFWTHYFLSFLSRIPLYQLSLSVLPLTYLGPILPLFHFVVVHWSIVNHAARLLWFTLFTIVSSLKGTVET